MWPLKNLSKDFQCLEMKNKDRKWLQRNNWSCVTRTIWCLNSPLLYDSLNTGFSRSSHSCGTLPWLLLMGSELHVMEIGLFFFWLNNRCRSRPACTTTRGFGFQWLIWSPHSRILSPTYGDTVHLGLEPMTGMLLSRTSWRLYYETGSDRGNWTLWDLFWTGSLEIPIGFVRQGCFRV